ncbi:hypothetical protein C0993_003380 [Termitomyces sp. T159_Od127]|nr:hypothetical protein C0993_003380 [Termitomyces sp. T159_Od127]
MHENEAVKKFVDQMKVVQEEEAKAALAKAKNDMAQYYDHGRTLAPKYQPRGPGLSGCLQHHHHLPVKEALAPSATTLHGGTTSRPASLPTLVPSRNATASLGIQRGQANTSLEGPYLRATPDAYSTPGGSQQQ